MSCTTHQNGSSRRYSIHGKMPIKGGALLVRAAKERGAVEELLAAAPMRMEEVSFDMIKNMGLFSGGGADGLGLKY